MSEIRHEDYQIETSPRHAWLDTLMSVAVMVVMIAFVLCAVAYMAFEAIHI